MRSPRRKRPRIRRIFVSADADLNDLARRAIYVGSPEHKDVRSFAGQPRLRADASCCPREIDLETARRWLRSAIKELYARP